MQHFGTADIARLASIPMHALRSMVRARYVVPGRGPRGALRFSFNDLVLLRTARSLLGAGLSPRRVGAALRNMRAQLPASLPPRGLSVAAAGGRVLINEAGGKRDAITGQFQLAFEVRVEGDAVRLVDLPLAQPVHADEPDGDCDRAFAAALELEETDVEAAIERYRACMAQRPHSGARANLGRLLHLQGRITEALQLYLAGDQSCADILYNQAVALEDLERTAEAISCYCKVLDLDADHADAHHNVARLLQQVGEHKRALRHWNAYRRLAGPDEGSR